MRIATKSGDKGKTGRLYGTRVSKASAVMHAVGDIDELNAAIGLLKSSMLKDDRYFKFLEKVQHALTLFMGEVASEPEKRSHYVSNYDYLKDSDLDSLDTEVNLLQDMSELDQQGWVLYGNSKLGAQADFTSKVCRRAERSFLTIVDLENAEPEENQCRSVLLKYLNRLSDFFHLAARYFDHLKTL
jgi:cob(I)alamin adenosyltransferase